jgi:hypothetical protein
MEIYANNVITDEEEVISTKPKKRHHNIEQLKLNAVRNKGVVKNIQHNANKHLLRVLGFGVFGAVIYPLVPTLLQAISERDMSGAKGLVLGVGTASTIGLALGKPEITIGAVSAMGTHLLYSKGTKVIEDITNTQIFRMNPNANNS